MKIFKLVAIVLPVYFFLHHTQLLSINTWCSGYCGSCGGGGGRSWGGIVIWGLRGGFNILVNFYLLQRQLSNDTNILSRNVGALGIFIWLSIITTQARQASRAQLFTEYIKSWCSQEVRFAVVYERTEMLTSRIEKKHVNIKRKHTLHSSAWIILKTFPLIRR